MELTLFSKIHKSWKCATNRSTGYMSINSKTSISKPSYKEFDLGNADESDFEDIYDEIQDTLMDLFY